MKRYRLGIACLSFCVAVLLAPGAFAAEEETGHGEQSQSEQAGHADEGGHGSAEEHPTFLGVPTPFWLVANLIIFWGAIFKFGGPPVKRFLDQRAGKISEDLALAKQQRQEALELSATLSKRVTELETEMKELVERSAGQAEEERKALLEQAAEEKTRIVEQTTGEIKNRVGLAKQELQEYAAKLATDLATEQLKRDISEKDGDRLFDEALERLSKEAVS